MSDSSSDDLLADLGESIRQDSEVSELIIGSDDSNCDRIPGDVITDNGKNIDYQMDEWLDEDADRELNEGLIDNTKDLDPILCSSLSVPITVEVGQHPDSNTCRFDTMSSDERTLDRPETANVIECDNTRPPMETIDLSPEIEKTSTLCSVDTHENTLHDIHPETDVNSPSKKSTETSEKKIQDQTISTNFNELTDARLDFQVNQIDSPNIDSDMEELKLRKIQAREYEVRICQLKLETESNKALIGSMEAQIDHFSRRLERDSNANRERQEHWDNVFSQNLANNKQLEKSNEERRREIDELNYSLIESRNLIERLTISEKRHREEIISLKHEKTLAQERSLNDRSLVEDIVNTKKAIESNLIEQIKTSESEIHKVTHELSSMKASAEEYMKESIKSRTLLETYIEQINTTALALGLENMFTITPGNESISGDTSTNRNLESSAETTNGVVRGSYPYSIVKRAVLDVCDKLKLARDEARNNKEETRHLKDRLNQVRDAVQEKVQAVENILEENENLKARILSAKSMIDEKTRICAMLLHEKTIRDSTPNLVSGRIAKRKRRYTFAVGSHAYPKDQRQSESKTHGNTEDNRRSSLGQEEVDSFPVPAFESIFDLIQENDSLRQHVETLRDHYDERVKEETFGATQELNDWRQRYSILSEEHSRLVQILEEFKNDNSTVRTGNNCERNSPSEIVGTIMSESETSRNSVEGLKLDGVDSTEQVNDMKSQLEISTKTIQDLAKSNRDLSDDINSVETRVKELNDKLRYTEERYGDCLKRLKYVESERDDIMEKYVSFSHSSSSNEGVENQEAKNTHTENHTNGITLREKLELETEISKLRWKTETLSSEKEKLLLLVKDVEIKFCDRSSQYEETLREIKSMAFNLNRENQTLFEERDKHRVNEFDRMSRESETKVEIANEKVKSLEKDLITIRTVKNEMDVKLQVLGSENQEMSIKMKKLKDRIRVLGISAYKPGKRPSLESGASPLATDNKVEEKDLYDMSQELQSQNCALESQLTAVRSLLAESDKAVERFQIKENDLLDSIHTQSQLISDLKEELSTVQSERDSFLSKDAHARDLTVQLESIRRSSSEIERDLKKCVDGLTDDRDRYAILRNKDNQNWSELRVKLEKEIAEIKIQLTEERRDKVILEYKLATALVQLENTKETEPCNNIAGSSPSFMSYASAKRIRRSSVTSYMSAISDDYSPLRFQNTESGTENVEEKLTRENKEIFATPKAQRSQNCYDTSAQEMSPSYKAELECEVVDLRLECSRLRKYLDEVVNDLKDRKQKMTDMSNYSDQLIKKLKEDLVNVSIEKESVERTAKSEKASTSSQLETLLSQKAEAERIQTQHSDVLSGVRQRLADLEQRNAALVADTQEWITNRQEYLTRVECLEKQIADLKAKNIGLNSNVADTDKYKDISSRYSSMESNISQITAHRDSSLAENECLTKERTVLLDKLRQMNVNLIKNRNESANKLKVHMANYTSLQKELKSAKETIELIDDASLKMSTTGPETANTTPSVIGSSAAEGYPGIDDQVSRIANIFELYKRLLITKTDKGASNHTFCSIDSTPLEKVAAVVTDNNGGNEQFDCSGESFESHVICHDSGASLIQEIKTKKSETVIEISPRSDSGTAAIDPIDASAVTSSNSLVLSIGAQTSNTLVESSPVETQKPLITEVITPVYASRENQPDDSVTMAPSRFPPPANLARKNSQDAEATNSDFGAEKNGSLREVGDAEIETSLSEKSEPGEQMILDPIPGTNLAHSGFRIEIPREQKEEEEEKEENVKGTECSSHPDVMTEIPSYSDPEFRPQSVNLMLVESLNKNVISMKHSATLPIAQERIEDPVDENIKESENKKLLV